jgi:hypothetical protein
VLSCWRLHAHVMARQRKGAEASKAGLSGKALDEALGMWEREEGEKQRPTRADFDDFVGAVSVLLTAMSGDRAAFEEVHGASEIAFFERTLENMRGRGANAYDNERLDPAPADVQTSDRCNRREALMAANLRWLMEQAYPGRKVIVWAPT